MGKNDQKITKLLWVDLEMSGLDPQKDRILEIAAIVTDFDFKELGVFEAVVSQTESMIEHLSKDSWWATQPGLKRLLNDIAKHGKPEAEVEERFADFITEHFGTDPAVLAGNSVHMDRLFMASHWTKVTSKLHYRIVDVSSFKIVMKNKYGREYQKPEIHRALGDIRASIAELSSYLRIIDESHGGQA